MASPDAEQLAPTEPARWRDLDMLLSHPGNLVESSFDPSPGLRDLLGSLVEVLIVGAGGLGCELLKDLALSGFKKLHVIDMDTIDVSNLNRQFLFRVQDVGKSKAEVAAKRVMERVNGVNIVPHFCRIEDKEIEFYSQFQIIVLGLDSIEARSYINSVACGFLEYDSNDNPLQETVKPMVDGGTEGFKGHARVIIPGTTPCFECNIWLFPPHVKFLKVILYVSRINSTCQVILCELNQGWLFFQYPSLQYQTCPELAHLGVVCLELLGLYLRL
ncbi:NEDD8-activating enzyme E1 catalytic subunit-like isoform X1 [Miscanthus floridulus]|uniref:NEDD8-activating enzyme E1 catalytic subunit-like isoform X1 n=1 Tax=Miscanthus floridulus TaxID=154761 RepID=UPI0034585E17